MSVGLASESKLIARHSLVYALGNFLNKIIALLLLPLYTRYLSPHDYGIKELIGLSTDVIGILLATSISSAVYRFYFECETKRERDELISTCFLSLGAVGLVAVGLLSLAAKPMAGLILDDRSLALYFHVSFSSMWFQCLNDIGNTYLRANHRSLAFIVLSAGRLLLGVALNIYFITVAGMGVLGILLSTLLTSVASCAVLVVPLLWSTGLHLSTAKLKSMLRFGLPLVPSQLGAFVVHLSDRFFIKAYCSIEEAGLYSLGYRFGTLPSTFIAGPFQQTWEPRRFQVYKQENAEKVFGRIFTYFVFLMVFAGLGICALAADVLKIMSDPKYWSAAEVVPIVVVATIVFSLHYHVNIGLLIAKKTEYLAVVNFSNGVLVLLLNWWMIPRWGVYGAAYATLIAFVYKVSLTYYWSKKYYRIHFELARVAKVFASGSLLYLACRALNVSNVVVAMGLKALLVSSLPLVLALTGFYESEEVQRVRQVLSAALRKLRSSPAAVGG